MALGGAREAILVARKVPSTVMLSPEALKGRVETLEQVLRVPQKVISGSVSEHPLQAHWSFKMDR